MLPIVCASGNFVVALGVFVVIGLNTPIATTYHTTPDDAGLVVTWYAVAYALAAPVSTALTGSASRKNALAAGLVLFAVASAAGAMAPNLFLPKLSRILAAIGAGIYLPGAAGVGQPGPARRPMKRDFPSPRGPRMGASSFTLMGGSGVVEEKGAVSCCARRNVHVGNCR